MMTPKMVREKFIFIKMKNIMNHITFNIYVVYGFNTRIIIKNAIWLKFSKKKTIS